MAQPRKPVRKKTIPKSLVKKKDHDIMERVFGKRVMRKIDEVAEALKGKDFEVMRKR